MFHNGSRKLSTRSTPDGRKSIHQYPFHPTISRSIIRFELRETFIVESAGKDCSVGDPVPPQVPGQKSLKIRWTFCREFLYYKKYEFSTSLAFSQYPMYKILVMPNWTFPEDRRSDSPMWGTRTADIAHVWLTNRIDGVYKHVRWRGTIPIKRISIFF